MALWPAEYTHAWLGCGTVSCSPDTSMAWWTPLTFLPNRGVGQIGLAVRWAVTSHPLPPSHHPPAARSLLRERESRLGGINTKALALPPGRGGFTQQSQVHFAWELSWTFELS